LAVNKKEKEGRFEMYIIWRVGWGGRGFTKPS